MIERTVPSHDGGLLPVSASKSVVAAVPSAGRLRAVSALLLFGLIAGWHWRTTGTASWSALGLIAGFVVACIAAGGRLAAASARLIGPSHGIASEFVLGFFFCNTLLFVLMLSSPFGIAANVAATGIAALTIGATGRFGTGAGSTPRGEAGSLVCIAFTGLAATLWVHDQQPLVTALGDQSVFKVWSDVFIHAREISAFAQSHGMASIEDIKLAGSTALLYHVAPYMMPAAFDALTGISALDAYAAFQLPFGILLVGLSAYALASACVKTTWPAVIAAAAVVSLPDAMVQGVGIRYLSFHFMSQVNLGMLYGIACAALTWLFMIEACRRGRIAGLFVAYLLLAILVMYKAHLFVANALILMLYPCIVFERAGGRIRTGWRVSAAIAVIVVFTAVIALSQLSPRVPTIRLDGSGIGRYVDILMGGFREGRAKALFQWLYYDENFPKIVRAGLAGLLIASGSFGAWVVVAPLAWWKTRRSIGRQTSVFLLLVCANYMVMSMGLALDERKVGSPEEFVNRPHAWAYFVVVLFGTAALCLWLRECPKAASLPRRWAVPVLALLAAVALTGVYLQASRLQTFPEWGDRADYAEFNGVPTCVVRAAHYIHDHGRAGELIQDGAYDPDLRVTALAERQEYVARIGFGGHPDQVSERIAALESAQAGGPDDGLATWAQAHRVTWYLAHPDDPVVVHEGRLAERIVFRCGGFSVLRFGSRPNRG